MMRIGFKLLRCFGFLLLAFGAAPATAQSPAVKPVPIETEVDVESRVVPSDEATEARKIFLIGNSLTWDTLPALLDQKVSWHVDCGKSLLYIHDHPQQPCVESSTAWTTALAQDQFDVLCVQPFNGTTLQQDQTTISSWMKMQPQAQVVIHTGWNRSAEFEAAFHESPQVWKDDAVMQHSHSYFAELQRRLQAEFPDRVIRSTKALELLDLIYHDIADRQAPLKEFSELYRDDIHMTTDAGRYLMHNRMRQALGQPMSEQGFQLDPAVKAYLDRKLNENSL